MALAAPLSILYRGPLSSCNYACPYCPFAKHTESPAQHHHDAQALTRFTGWVAAQTCALSVLFTPWGEALVRPRYQQAISGLSRLAHLQQVAIQTNLSGRLDWLQDADRSKVGLWATFHPGEVSLERFLGRCAELDALGVRYSVGVVGHKSHFAALAELRSALPAQVYLWVNAFKGGAGPGTGQGGSYYTAADLAFLSAIDPLFEVNTRHYPVRGQRCGAGESAISVDGDGTVRRCHFLERPLGNLYSGSLEAMLQPRACTRAHCECHIGYVHLPQLQSAEIYGAGLLARIPEGPQWADPAAYLERARQLMAGPQASAAG
ncbi:STM4011 family radical SAM protein [Deinococcus sp. QL22]|uniref:STM4011 family radical SAM protein n=1 Tax=Deinococcus sp. QL22 TaxID=2939437 RepID=UPI002016C32F|nr:STM4011 family radical SAM protein [Deinococcus sp. QL22]UQN08832.1 STM4011 family radical SAM protein [Deinococcus sp. QL22]